MTMKQRFIEALTQGRQRLVTFWKQHPAAGFLTAAGLCGLWGQYQILTGQLTPGLAATGLGIVLALVATAGRSRLQDLGSRTVQIARQSTARLAHYLRERLSRFQPAQDEKPDPTAVSPGMPVAPAAHPVEPEGPVWGQAEVVLSKGVFLGAGLFLLAVSQPFLFFEKFLWGLGLLLPGLSLLLFAIFSKKNQLSLGRVRDLLKVVLLALPGLAVIVVGNLLMKKNMEIHMRWEVVGYGLNALGILMLLALLPRILPDPEPEADAMDRPTSLATTPWQVMAKLLLVGLSVILFFISNKVAGAGGFDKAVLLALLGIAALGFSFPWARPSAPVPSSEPLRRLAGQVFRLLAWGLAVGLAYQGQALIAQEQLYPGLYRLAAAALLLVLGLREPSPGEPDRLKEAPLAWYWEALGLLAVLAAATWLRSYLLDSMPFGIECDEAGAGHHAVDILNNEFNSITIHPSGRPLFMLLPKVVAFHFFGIDNVGMRFMAMFWGVVGTGVFYLLARFWYGPRVALATTALLALSRWHIHFSRFGWANTLMLVLLMVGFYFLVKGLTSRKKWYFVLSGFSLTLSIHTETAARMVPFICLGLLVYFILTRRHFLRRNALPLVAFFLGVWLAGANLFIFWTNKPAFLINRVQEVSVFSQDVNAPKQILPGLVTSTKLSLLQMNWHGDTRGRHNGGLTGEPMLDFWSAILFALGFGLAMFHWRRLRYFLPLIWFFGFMSASIFAMEAPQSHRAFGVVPAVFLLMAAFLDRSRRLWRETLGRPGAIASGIVLLLLLIPVGRINYHKYFDAFPGFDTNCTAAARYIGREWRGAYQAFMSAHLWIGHPPFILYARGIEGNFYYSPSEIVPFRMETDKDVLFTTIFEYPPIIPTIQYFYPKGVFHEEVHPKFELLFRSWGVRHEDIMATRGLTGSYYDNATGQGKPRLVRKDLQILQTWDDQTWPLSGPGSVTWEGTILIPHWGTYTLYLDGTDEIEMQVGHHPVLRTRGNQEGRQTLTLAGGLHRLRVHAQHRTPGGRAVLAWSSSTAFLFHFNPLQDRFAMQPVPSTHLYTYPAPVGLLGTYYATDHWSGRVRLQKVEPAVFFFWTGNPYGLEPPLSVDWRGWIMVDQAGAYRFDVETEGYGEVEIDGRVVLRQGAKPTEWPNREVGSNPVSLSVGKHPIVVRWSMSYGKAFKFWWTPPGRTEREVVPPGVLIPAEE